MALLHFILDFQPLPSTMCKFNSAVFIASGHLMMFAFLAVSQSEICYFTLMTPLEIPQDTGRILAFYFCIINYIQMRYLYNIDKLLDNARCDDRSKDLSLHDWLIPNAEKNRK